MPTSVIVLAESVDALHAAGVAAHRAGVGFAEADRHAVRRGQHHFVARLGDHDVDQLVVFPELDGDDAALQRPAVGLELGLLHQALARGHHQVVVGLVEVADRAAVGDLLALGQVEQVDDRPAAALARQLRQVVDLLPVDLALVGEEQQVVVRAGDEQVLDRIFFLGLGALEALAAAALRAVDAGRRALDVAVVRDRDDHRLFGDQVFQVDVADLFAADLGAARVAVLALQLLAILADDREDAWPRRRGCRGTRRSPRAAWRARRRASPARG